MTVLIDIHAKTCTCSYCTWQMRYGLNVPQNWRAWNSWYVVKFGPRHYMRWTNTWPRRFQQPEAVTPTSITKIAQ